MDPKERFSIRADDYVKYRPSYPVEVINLITEECKLTNESVIADIGSGTGLFTSLFDNRVRTIFGVEPNKEMRDKAISFLKGQRNYLSVRGDSENTNLDSNSVDAVVCAQAFHWFDPEKTKIEFKRILKDLKYCALIWNIRDTNDPFIAEYEKLLDKYCRNYNDAAHNRDFKDVFKVFFTEYKETIFLNPLLYDYESLCGLLNSSSYVPLKEDDNNQNLFDGMKTLFDIYQINMQVTINYVTKVYYGVL